MAGKDVYTSYKEVKKTVTGLSISIANGVATISWNKIANDKVKRLTSEANPNVKGSKETRKEFSLRSNSVTNGYVVRYYTKIKESGKFEGYKEETVNGYGATTLQVAIDTNVTEIKVQVRPVSGQYTYTWYKHGTKTVNKKTVDVYEKQTKKRDYFTPTFCTAKTAEQAAIISRLSVPTVTASMDGNACTISSTYTETGVSGIEFEYATSKATKTVKKTIDKKSGIDDFKFTFAVEASLSIKVRAKAIGKTGYNDSFQSSWSWSKRATPGKVPSVSAGAGPVENSAKVTFSYPTNGADKYEIQYVSGSKEMFNSTAFNRAETTSSPYSIHGLDADVVWFFRIRAVNEGDTGESYSAWTYVNESVTVNSSPTAGGTVIGTDPTAPTTWQTSSIVKKGDNALLHWVHNCEDGCTATKSVLSMRVVPSGQVITKTLGEGVYEYAFDTSSIPDGSRVMWRVTTTAVTGVDSEPSATREFTVYVTPACSAYVDEDVEEFPLSISVSGSTNQSVVSYDVRIHAKDTHEATMADGSTSVVMAGDTVFSESYATSLSTISVSIGPEAISLTPGESYYVEATVCTSSGLRATSQPAYFNFVPTVQEHSISIGTEVNEKYWNCTVRPVAFDGSGDAVATDVKLSVFRIGHDGRTTTIAEWIDNGASVLDYHPNLGTCTYRIVCHDTDTGGISYEDVEVSVPCKSVLVQWNEGAAIGDEDEGSDFSGRILDLPYDQELSFNYSPDIEHKQYIGRSHPVGYYGTQLGETSSMTVAIRRDDMRRLSLVRELAAWMDDVYVREPSGAGYYASAVPSIERRYDSQKVPVTLDVTRHDHAEKVVLG